MKLVTIASPFSGDTEGNIAFAQNVCWYATQLLLAPFAPHLIYPFFLDDDTPADRELGHSAGIAWGSHCDEVWFCLLAGTHSELSPGMYMELQHYQRMDKPCFFLLFDVVETDEQAGINVTVFPTLDELTIAAQRAWLEKQRVHQA